ncbi:MAG: ABC transporter ATP-binding protein [Myxococcota bacterium]
MNPALQFTDVRKRFGSKTALDGLSFTIPRGTVAGFVGHNGAGKTTAFSVVSGFLPLDAGTFSVLDRVDPAPRDLKGRLGVLPQDAALPERHTPRELLRHLAQLAGLTAAKARLETDRYLDVVGLADRRDDLVATLSHGMRRRVAVASALVGDPELVLLDEPLAGLDPVQAHALREVLASLRGTQTLVISSHNLTELERLCDWVVMLREGRCIRQGTVESVSGQQERVRWRLGGVAPLDALQAALPGHRFEADGDTLLQHAPPEADLDQASLVVMATLAGAGVPLRGLSRGMGLERRFIDDLDQNAS